MTDPAIIEAAARAICAAYSKELAWEDTAESGRIFYHNLAKVALTAVTPMVEAAVLERAAQVAEHSIAERWLGDQVAAAIRALKPPAESSAA